MDLKGYCTIKPGAQPTHCMGQPKDYYEVPLRVLDWGVDGSALVVTPAGNQMGDFPPEAIARSFRCTEVGHVLCPPDLDPVARMVYVSRCMGRKGGYNQTLRNMVVVASLQKGVFTDSFLWTVENEESRHRKRITAEWLMSIHLELDEDEAELYRQFCQRNTIVFQACYGDGTIMWPKWQAFNEEIKSL